MSGPPGKSQTDEDDRGIRFQCAMPEELPVLMAQGYDRNQSLLAERLRSLHLDSQDFELVNIPEYQSWTDKDRKADRHSESFDGPTDITELVKKKLKAHLREKFTYIYEGTSDSRSRLEDIYTRLYITHQPEEYGRIPHEILDQFKLTDKVSANIALNFEQINCLNIFKPGRQVHQQRPAKERSIQKVMTKGIAGIGKTVAVQMFSLNWAEGKSNQHIDFIFVLPFRELNMLKDCELSLLQLLLHFYPELTMLEDTQQLVKKQLLFIFDGLDESRFPLDFEGGKRMSEIIQQATVDVLVTNLIRGNLLPDALLWITSRPAAASQIPNKYIDQMTEVQGFTEQEREDYFKKKCSSASQAKEVLSYLKGLISFYFMGHIPIFCWIIAEVLKKGWSNMRSRRITTMTELYIFYLQIQTERTTRKYGKKSKKRRLKRNQNQ